ncbi:hypothetical protein QZH41_003020 [Actinostola sp. cb2023]|nr:hypothetical protein QZH41_003020 [Actinostola sp. cb2023]
MVQIMQSPSRESLRKTPTLDIGFLIENPTNNIHELQEWNGETKDVFIGSRDFVRSFVKNFNVSVTDDHIGIITYGDKPYMNFDFNEHLSNNRIRKAISGLHRPSSGSNTVEALTFAKKQLFQGSARPESRKYLIILASDSSKDDSPKVADELKKSGVKIYTIGIDSKDGIVQLNDVVSEPIESHKFLTSK